MHELSIALEICRMVEQRLGPAQVHRVVAVGLEVGNDAGVEVESLRFCLEALLTSPPFHAAVPELARRPGDVLRLSYLTVDDGSPQDATAGAPGTAGAG